MQHSINRNTKLTERVTYCKPFANVKHSKVYFSYSLIQLYSVIHPNIIHKHNYS